MLDFEEKIPDNAGRIAAQTAKQVVLQRLREAERDAVFEEYAGKEGEIIIGTVQRVEARQVIIELGKGTEAVLPLQRTGPQRAPSPGPARSRSSSSKCRRPSKGPQVVVSRAHRNLLRRLFEMEVPEIFRRHRRDQEHRPRRLATAARSPSIARNQSVDPIGACVGMRGIRIQNIVNELSGERIDVIKWDPDPANFVSNALSPAQVVEVTIDDDEHRATVVVPDRMLSLAIGKEGQNARLAAKLTGWRIDIHSQSASERVSGRARRSAIAASCHSHPAKSRTSTSSKRPKKSPPPHRHRARRRPRSRRAAPGGRRRRAEEEDVDLRDRRRRDGSPGPRRARIRGLRRRGRRDDEEYEVPTTVVAEARADGHPLRRGRAAQAPEKPKRRKKAVAKKVKRAPRFVEETEEDMEEIDYSGRIH